MYVLLHLKLIIRYGTGRIDHAQDGGEYYGSDDPEMGESSRGQR